MLKSFNQLVDTTKKEIKNLIIVGLQLFYHKLVRSLPGKILDIQAETNKVVL